MAYARFGYADVYVYMHVSGWLECCGCILRPRGSGDEEPTWPSVRCDSTQVMVDHLGEHRAAGHEVPDGIEADLWADDEDNWVTYQRCAVEGCEERVTCGSPVSGGSYVSCCSVAHAQTLGGFPDFPQLTRPLSGDSA